MSTEKKKNLKRERVSELPLIKDAAEKIGLHNILNNFLPKRKNADVSHADTLMLLIYNMAGGKNPLYMLEEWVRSIDLRCIDYEKHKNVRFTDDRFGMALDALFSIDRATLMTAIVTNVVKQFHIDLDQIHNDSTSVSAHGEYPNASSTGFELKRGKSKDNNPHLKQLIFTLSISADGAVPIHYKGYPGNRNDDSTHIETWNTLRTLCGKPDFLYVADCKLCTNTQLDYIAENHGRAITNIPENWSEVVEFKNELRRSSIPKSEIWRRPDPETGEMVYFSAFEGNRVTKNKGYKIHWIHSSSKRDDDCNYRERELSKAEEELTQLNERLNKRRLISEKAIRDAIDAILKKRESVRFLDVVLTQTEQTRIIKSGRGRPDKVTEYPTITRPIFAMTWKRNTKALDEEEKVDGVYPLVCTDPRLSAKEVLVAYKYQPKLEKRFSQLKSTLNIAPLLFKKIERVEASLFVFFIALMIQALIEREVREKMKTRGLKTLEIYPEGRETPHPTTSKVFGIFDEVFTYAILSGGDIVEEYHDDLTEIQMKILGFLNITEAQYWNGAKKIGYTTERAAQFMGSP